VLVWVAGIPFFVSVLLLLFMCAFFVAHPSQGAYQTGLSPRSQDDPWLVELSRKQLDQTGIQIEARFTAKNFITWLVLGVICLFPAAVMLRKKYKGTKSRK
jgi:hypothetical protein